MTDRPIREIDGVLHFGGVSLAAIGESVGPPFYAYDVATVARRYEALAAALAGANALVCYAMKANGHPALWKPLVARGAGVEVVSGAELLLAVRGGVPPERIVFSGVGKNEDELRAALRCRIGLLVVESEEELALLDELAGAARWRPPIALRVNPEVDAGTHPHIATGVRQAKFGLDVDTALDLYRRWKEFGSVEWAGVHAHIGSQITRLEPLAASARALVELVRAARANGAPLVDLDVGGGLGIPYADEPAPSLEEYGRAMREIAAALDVRLIVEPGRALVGPAGVLVVRALYRKTVHGRAFLVVDAGMNDFLRPALYGAEHAIAAVRRRPGPARRVDVVGAVCESADVFGRDRLLPPVERGDLLAILDAGAYGSVMSSNYNLRPRPAEVVVEGTRVRPIRRRESWEELVERELSGEA